jgi:hypothetical protein
MLNSDSDFEDLPRDPLEDDREILNEEEEREKLLTSPEAWRDRHAAGTGKVRKRSRRRERKRNKRRDNGEEGTEFFNMEEGEKGRRSNASSRSSLESSRERESTMARARVGLQIAPLYVY